MVSEGGGGGREKEGGLCTYVIVGGYCQGAKLECVYNYVVSVCMEAWGWGLIHKKVEVIATEVRLHP